MSDKSPDGGASQLDFVVCGSRTAPASEPATARGASSATGGGTNGATTNTATPAFAKPSAPTGNAVLSIVSGFPAQTGVTNPLAGRPYLLLRDNVGTVLAKSGIPLPAGIPVQEEVMVTTMKAETGMLKISRGHWRGRTTWSSVRRERQSRASRSSAGHVLSDGLDKDRQPKPILEREAGSESGRKFAGGRSTQRRAGK